MIEHEGENMAFGQWIGQINGGQSRSGFTGIGGAKESREQESKDTKPQEQTTTSR